MRIRYGVQCTRHGMEGKNWDGKMVMVTQPKTKKQRFEGGCPLCKSEKAATAAAR